MGYEKDDSKSNIATTNGESAVPVRADAAPKPKNLLAKSLAVERNPPAKAKAGGHDSFQVILENTTDESLAVSGSFLPLGHARSVGSPQAFKFWGISPNPMLPGARAMALMGFRPKHEGTHRATLELKIDGKSELTYVHVTGNAEATEKREPETSKPKSPSKDEPISVGIVDIGDHAKEHSDYETMLKTWAELVEIGLENLNAALSNFETVARSPSSKETIPEGAAKLIWEEIHKHHVDHLVAYMFKPLPWGSEIGEFFAIGSWNEAIAKEKQRAKRAGEDHVLMKFIVATREWITNKRGSFKGWKHNRITKLKTDHYTRNDVEQTLDRSNLMAVNGRLRNLVLSGAGTTAGHYQNLVCQWANGSKAPGGKEDAHVKIRYDKNWNLMSTKLVAIHGERLAEQLFAGGRTVDLQTLPVRRIVEWMPYLDADAKKAKLEQKVFNFQGIVDETGAHVKTRYSPMAQAHKPAFEAKMASLRLPVVSDMQGSGSK